MTPEALSRNPQTARNEAADRLREMLRDGIHSDYPYSEALADIDAALDTARAEAAQRVVERIRAELVDIGYSSSDGWLVSTFLPGLIGDSAGEEEGQP